MRRGGTSTALVLLLALTALLPRLVTRSVTPELLLDGHRLSLEGAVIHLCGSHEGIHPGDILTVNQRRMVVREARSSYRFSLDHRQLTLEGQPVFWDSDSPTPLSDQAWGAELRGAPPPGLRLDRTFVTWRAGAELPPPTVQYLDWNGIPPPGLIFFSFCGGRFDAAALRNLRQLRGLGIHAPILEHSEALASLPELRWLSLACTLSFEETSCLGHLPELVQVELDGTSVTNLAPLQGDGRLQFVSADLTPLKNLPSSPVGWTRLTAIDTELSVDTVHNFQRRNPICAVYGDWEAPLEKLRGATRLEIVGRRRVTVQDPSAIGELLAGLHFQSSLQAYRSLAREPVILGERKDLVNGFRCMCEGGPTLIFDDREILSNQHGEGLRWLHSPWPGDAILTPPSAEFYTAWLARYGVNEPQLELRATTARRTPAAGRRAPAPSGR